MKEHSHLAVTISQPLSRANKSQRLNFRICLCVCVPAIVASARRKSRHSQPASSHRKPLFSTCQFKHSRNKIEWADDDWSLRERASGSLFGRESFSRPAGRSLALPKVERVESESARLTNSVCVSGGQGNLPAHGECRPRSWRSSTMCCHGHCLSQQLHWKTAA